MEQHKYRSFKVKNKVFIVKLDLDPISNDYEYHMDIRHLVTPQDAIRAYFNKTTETYNKKYDRYELYSQSMNITVFYTYLKDENIFLITAFYEGETIC